MLRESRLKKEPEIVKGFRMRGSEVSRVEAFSDAVFAFALTLLVVSLEVPKTFDELLLALRGFLGFGLCFLLLFQLWSYHYLFFRRYGLEDATIRWLNAVLLFVILAYVYPLKFVFTLLISSIFGQDRTSAIAPGQLSTLFTIYGAGFAAVYLTFAAFYWHAHRQTEKLELTELERFDTKWYAIENLLFVLVAGISITIAWIDGGRFVAFAGMSYFLIGMTSWWHGATYGRKRRELEARLAKAGH